MAMFLLALQCPLNIMQTSSTHHPILHHKPCLLQCVYVCSRQTTLSIPPPAEMPGGHTVLQKQFQILLQPAVMVVVWCSALQKHLSVSLPSTRLSLARGLCLLLHIGASMTVVNLPWPSACISTLCLGSSPDKACQGSSHERCLDTAMRSLVLPIHKL